MQRFGSPGCHGRKQPMSTRLSSYFRFLPGVCLIAFVVSTTSCRKHSASDNHCITREVPKMTDQGVSGPALDSIYNLFASNNLSTDNLQFQAWVGYTTSNPTYSGPQEQVWATQFFNGLPVFREDENFVFNAGKYQPGNKYNGYTGPAPGADSSGNQGLPGLRSAFLDHVSQSIGAGGPRNARPFIPSRLAYMDSCLIATLGYLDAGMVPGKSPLLETALIKVWKVTPLNGQYPLVYVEDDNGLAWGVAFFMP
jgi:hypothetical protein